jgi:hypothetical protein
LTPADRAAILRRLFFVSPRNGGGFQGATDALE